MKYSFLIAINLLIGIFAVNVSVAQGIFYTTSGNIKFFSEAPIENIEAISDEAISVFNTETGQIAFQVKINTFQFEKALMQEHFNENYMESGKIPKASFRGIVLNFDSSLKTVQKVLLKGDLNIHGVSINREIPASLQLSDDNLLLKTTFNVLCKDHDIKIPKLLWKNIAETIEVDVNANYKKRDDE